MGGSNTFLGTVFIATACAMVLIMVVFMIMYVAKISNNASFYDIDNAKW